MLRLIAQPVINSTLTDVNNINITVSLLYLFFLMLFLLFLPFFLPCAPESLGRFDIYKVLCGQIKNSPSPPNIQGPVGVGRLLMNIDWVLTGHCLTF